MNLKEKYNAILEKQNLLNEKLDAVRTQGITDINNNGGLLESDTTLTDLMAAINTNDKEMKVLIEKNGHVIIPDTVTSIKEYAFAGSDITGVTIPASVTEIGNYAFKDCKSLKEVILYNSLPTELLIEIFQGCPNNLKVTLRPGKYDYVPVMELWEHCEEIVLDEGIKYLGVDMSYVTPLTNASNLKKIYIPTTLEGTTSYRNFPYDINFDIYIKDLKKWCELENYWSGEDGPFFNNKGGLYLNNELITDLSLLPSDATTISSCMFEGYSHFTELIIPEGITSIGNRVFSECPNLTKIILPKTLKHIGREIIFLTPYWLNLSNWIGNLLYIDDCLIDSMPWTTGSTSLSIKSGTRIIADRIGDSLETEISVTIPASVEYIGERSFQDCSIASINVSSSNKHYSSKDGVLFNKDKSVLVAYPSEKTNISYTIPSSVKKLKQYAFYYTNNLQKLIFSNGIEKIEEFTLCALENLQEITFSDSIKEIEPNVLMYTGWINQLIINCPWSEGEIPGAPWGAWDITINYNYGKEV